MTELRAYALLSAVGIPYTLGCILGLAAVCGDGEAQAAAAVICLIVMSFLVGVVGLRYDRPRDSSDR